MLNCASTLGHEVGNHTSSGLRGWHPRPYPGTAAVGTDLLHMTPPSLPIYDAAKASTSGGNMARRNKSSPAEDFIVVASKLPWWASLLLAVVCYLVLRAYANQPIVISTAPGKSMDYLLPAMLKGIATFGQYVLPILLVIAAGVSWYKSRKAETTQQPASGLGSKPSPVSNQQSPSCPVCSSAMILREAKRGANAGKSFFGCSDYPRCKGTRAAG